LVLDYVRGRHDVTTYTRSLYRLLATFSSRVTGEAAHRCR
jgi:hypothetical protein